MLPYRNHIEKSALLKSGKLSLTDNVNFFLKRIEENRHLNAYNFVFGDEALQKASEVEDKIKSGKAGKLAGMVLAIKDVLSIEGKPMTCSSKMLENFEALYTATAVKKLIDEDAIIIGKTSCDEFAMGSSNENSAFGPVLNPADITRVPGGSSGGSAAAVAAFLCDASLGTDTGGSIRQPASFCGIFGLKPTYGLVSRYGLTAFASSFDTVGPFSRDISDARLLLETMAGKDQLDSTSCEPAALAPALSVTDNGKPKIGIPKEYFGEGIDPEVKKAVESSMEKLRQAGYTLCDISLPHTEYAIAAYYILTTAEASSNLARYGGVHYGRRADNPGSLKGMYEKSRTEAFGSEVKRRIMLGTYVLSAGYYDAYYKKAQQVRRLIRNDFDNAFKNVGLILTPTAPTTAFKLGEKSASPLSMYLSDIYTISANLAGIPALSIPVAADSCGLPIGLQFMARQFDENSLFGIGSFFRE